MSRLLPVDRSGTNVKHLRRPIRSANKVENTSRAFDNDRLFGRRIRVVLRCMCRRGSMDYDVSIEQSAKVEDILIDNFNPWDQ
jgi:hypothetical protein